MKRKPSTSSTADFLLSILVNDKLLVFQLNELAESYSTQMSQYAVVTVPGQHVIVRGPSW